MGAAALPCSVHTFGFGSDHDANMLKGIADKGTGTYFFLQTKDDIPDAFADCLGGLLSVVGQNMTLELLPQNGCVIKKVHGKFKLTTNGAASVLALGDLQSEEERDILCTVTLPSLVEPAAATPLLRATLAYFNVVSSRNVERAAVCAVDRPAALGSAAPNLKVDVHKNRIMTADAMLEAKELADKNQLAEARGVIQNAIAALKKSLSAEEEFVKSLVVDLEKTLEGLQDRTSYTSYGYQNINAAAGSHFAQRSAGRAVSSPTYGTTSKSSVKSAFQ